MSDIAEFKSWLIDVQGLGDRTAHTYYKAVKSMAKRKTLLASLRDDRAASTKHLYWAALKQWAAYQEDDVLLEELNSPAIRRLAMKTGKPPRAIEPYTDEEVEIFRKALDHLRDAPGVDAWIWPAISLLLSLGLRARVDLCRLTREEVVHSIGTGRLTIRTKQDKLRVLPAITVLDELTRLAAIKKWNQLSDLIAPHSTDPETLAYRYIVRILKQIAKLSGLDPKTVRSHRFRHTAAMKLYKASGHDIQLVQKFLGHSQLETTVGYLRLDRTDEMGEVLERMKHGV